jgi:microcystin-dependent protein
MDIDKETVVNGFAAVLATATILSPSATLACSPEPYIGSICITAAQFCPARTHVEANGQLLAINQFQSLFSLLGTNYGGNGTTTFAVPDMRGRTPVGVGTGPGLSSVATGAKRGTDYMTLTIQHMPTHSHAASFSPDGGSAAVSVQASTKTATKAQAAAGDYIASDKPIGGAMRFITAADAGTTVALGGVSGGGAGGGTVQVENSGDGQAFANYPPQQALKYCIATQGTYPSRE